MTKWVPYHSWNKIQSVKYVTMCKNAASFPGHNDQIFYLFKNEVPIPSTEDHRTYKYCRKIFTSQKVLET